MKAIELITVFAILAGLAAAVHYVCIPTIEIALCYGNGFCNW